jgi:hypothetical protein
MIKAILGKGEFTINDNQTIEGGNSQARSDFAKAKSIRVEIYEGPVAAVLFQRMDSMRGNYVLKERKDPKGVF